MPYPKRIEINDTAGSHADTTIDEQWNHPLFGTKTGKHINFSEAPFLNPNRKKYRKGATH
jgi:hypothetical protein